MAGPGIGWDGPVIDDHPAWTAARSLPRWVKIAVPVLALAIPVVTGGVLAVVLAHRASGDAAATTATHRAPLAASDTPSASALATASPTSAASPLTSPATTVATPTTPVPTTAVPPTSVAPTTTAPPSAPPVAGAAAGGGATGGLAAPSGATAPPSSASPPATAVSYANCAAVRAAGKAPLYRGQPDYAPHLDRDNDGIACES